MKAGWVVPVIRVHTGPLMPTPSMGEFIRHFAHLAPEKNDPLYPSKLEWQFGNFKVRCWANRPAIESLATRLRTWPVSMVGNISGFILPRRIPTWRKGEAWQRALKDNDAELMRLINERGEG